MDPAQSRDARTLPRCRRAPLQRRRAVVAAKVPRMDALAALASAATRELCLCNYSGAALTVRPHDEFTRTPPPPAAPPPAISTDKEAEMLTLDETWAKIAATLADEMQELCHVPDDALLAAAPAARSPRVSAMSHVYDAAPPPRPVMAPPARRGVPTTPAAASGYEVVSPRAAADHGGAATAAVRRPAARSARSTICAARRRGGPARRRGGRPRRAARPPPPPTRRFECAPTRRRRRRAPAAPPSR